MYILGASVSIGAISVYTGCIRGSYRVVDPPHEHTQEGLAGSEELHLLTHKMLLLGLGLAGAARHCAAAVRGHDHGSLLGSAARAPGHPLGTDLVTGIPLRGHWPQLPGSHVPPKSSGLAAAM